MFEGAPHRMSADTAIDRIETWACTIPLPAALSFGSFTINKRHYAVLRMVTKGGLVADCVGHTRGSPVDVAIADLFAPALLGKDALDHGERLADIARMTVAMEDDGVLGRARSMIDICLWDLKAQALGVPLWRLLGGSPRTVAVGLVEGYEIAGETENDIAARLAGRTGEGFSFLKMEAAHYGDPQAVRRILSDARTQAKTDVRFTCDLAWSCKTARDGIAAAEAWRDLGVDWIEDPMYRTKVSEIAFLRRHSPVPIGVGDEVTRPLDLDSLMEREAVDVVRIDATTIGGITPALALAARAAARGLKISYHVNPEVHRHCVFADTAADHIEIFPTDRPFDCSHMLLEHTAFADVSRGRLTPPEGMGTGLRLDLDSVGRFAYRHASRTRQ
jgi:L-alanine-DL-glutamate epimerase-like enolase superfamily enzyme